MKKDRFQLILEAIQTMNSDRETKLADYQDKLAKYNTNKNKFMAILTSQPQEQWEAAAAKIINGNIYLSKKWALDKQQFSIDTDTKKVQSNELSVPEVTALNTKLIKDKQILAQTKADIDKKIKDDLRDIQTK